MTPEQLSTLKAALIADTAIAALKEAHDTQGIADYLCGLSTFVVTKTALSRHDILTGTSGGSPGEISASGGAASTGSAVLNVSVQLAASAGAQAGGAGNLTATVTLTAAGFIQAMGAGALLLARGLELLLTLLDGVVGRAADVEDPVARRRA